jgi:hypothetical protein
VVASHNRIVPSLLPEQPGADLGHEVRHGAEGGVATGYTDSVEFRWVAAGWDAHHQHLLTVLFHDGALSPSRRPGLGISRIEEQTLLFFDTTTRELLRTRPNPLTRDQALRLRGVRPAGPPPRPSSEPIRIQRRASEEGLAHLRHGL